MKIGSRKPVLVATAAVVGVLAVATGVSLSQSASAASSSPSPAPSGRPSGAPDGHWAPGGPRGGGPGGPGGPGGGPDAHGQLLHGEEVVQQGGKVVTVDEQAGKVTAASATSITVRSTDGFTATYVLNSGTKVGKKGAQAKVADLAVGDTVRVEGVKSGSSVTATRVMDGVPPQRPADGSRPPGAIA